MKLAFIFLVLLLMTLTGLQTQACSCMDAKNFQQAAQNPNAIIAEVTALKNTNGLAQVKVEKYFKGAQKEMNLTIQGQDGLNCNGYTPEVNQTVVLIFEKRKGQYETSSCADTTAIKNKNQNYEITLGENIEVTKDELQKLIDYKLQPKVLSTDCSINISRMAVPYDNDTKHLNFSYHTIVSTSTTTLSATIDLSNKANNIHEVFLYLDLTKKNATTYQSTINLKDPFTGLTVSNFKETVNLKQKANFSGPVMTRSTALDGHSKDQPDQPFLSHATAVQCWLNLGKPLEVVENLRN